MSGRGSGLNERIVGLLAKIGISGGLAHISHNRLRGGVARLDRGVGCPMVEAGYMNHLIDGLREAGLPE